jgi:glycosyl transferase family 25
MNMLKNKKGLGEGKGLDEKYQILVVHVQHFQERSESIERQMKEIGFSFHYILDGDVDTIDDNVLARYFKDGKDDMYHAQPATSCALKHFYAYEYILNHYLEGALILEDDAILKKNFLPYFLQSIDEYERRFSDTPVIISYENSSLTFVPGSMRRKGVMLYRAKKDRFTGGYFINRQGAKAILDDVRSNKCELAIDGYHNNLLHRNKLIYLWSHPTLIQQGTCMGKFSTSISKDDWLPRLRWYCKLFYKSLLYYFR